MHYGSRLETFLTKALRKHNRDTVNIHYITELNVLSNSDINAIACLIKTVQESEHSWT